MERTAEQEKLVQAMRDAISQLENFEKGCQALLHNLLLFGTTIGKQLNSAEVVSIAIEEGLLSKCISIFEGSCDDEAKLKTAQLVYDIFLPHSGALKRDLIRAMNPLLLLPHFMHKHLLSSITIATRTTSAADEVLDSGILTYLQKLVESRTSEDKVAELLSCLMGVRPPVKTEHVCDAVPLILTLMKCTNKETKLKALWAITQATHSSLEVVEKVVAGNVIPCLIGMLHSGDFALPALRTIGNISAHQPRELIDELLAADLLTHLSVTIELKQLEFRKFTCWILSNIAAGTKDQIQRLIDDTTIMSKLASLIKADSDLVVKEALWTMHNIASDGFPEHVLKIVNDYDALSLICSSLHERKSKLHEVILTSIIYFLEAGDELTKKFKPNPFAHMVNERTRKKIRLLAEKELYQTSCEQIQELLADANMINTIFKSRQASESTKSRINYRDITIMTHN